MPHGQPCQLASMAYYSESVGTEYWSFLSYLTEEDPSDCLANESILMANFLEDDSKVWKVWKAFLSAPIRCRVDLFKWLLSLRPDAINLKHPPLKFKGTQLNGFTLIHLVLLWKPCDAYFELVKHLIADCDADGNSCLFYAALSGNLRIYERVWSLLQGDGKHALLPGPKTCAVIVKADCLKLASEHLIRTLGGIEAALNFCIKENSPKLANRFLRILSQENLEKAMKIAMTESIVYFSTLYALVMIALNRKQQLHFEAILERLFGLCKRFLHHRQFILLISILRKQKLTRKTADELVSFTVTPYKLLVLIHQHRSIKLDLSQIDHNAYAFNLPSSVYGSFLHVLCKRISAYPVVREKEYYWHKKLSEIHFPMLFKITEAKHWKIRDSKGKKPVEYLSDEILKGIDAEIAEKLRIMNK